MGTVIFLFPKVVLNYGVIKKDCLRQYYTVTITYGSDVKGFDAVRVGRGMPRAPVPFSAVVVRHTAGEASRSLRCPRHGCQGAGRGVANKQVSQQAGLYLQYVQKRRCWYLVAPEPFGDGVRDLGDCSGRGSKKSAARTYDFSGRTWTPLILPVRGGGGCEEESGMARVPSQWEGTGQDKGRKRDGRGFLTMGRNGPGQGEKRDGRGSPTMGRNGPGQGGNGMAGAPPQWEGTGRDKGREAESELCAVLFLTRPRDVGAARGRRFAAVAVGELGGVRVLSAGRSTGSGADSVDAVEAVGSALIFCPGSEKERNFSATKVCTHHPRSRCGRWFAEIVSVHPAQTSPWCHRKEVYLLRSSDDVPERWTGVGGLRSPTFELGEQTAPRSSDKAMDWTNDKELTGLYDGLWQEPRVGPSGQHEPSTEGGRGAGLRAPESRQFPEVDGLAVHGFRKRVPVTATDARCNIFLAVGQEEDGGDCGLCPQTTQSHRSVANGRSGSQFMCGTKGGGKPVGLGGALPRERTLSGNVVYANRTQLLGKFDDALKQKRSHLAKKKVLFHQANAPAH
ncbi:hypothetical protein GEV33_003339 [Tenebrio molitor]|uniref:Uncharacterized protein n=1 Tax=Tenebrio molitor TaxID=7067 RepID=A0A8J6HRR6_TENMO|nr:hypothetical protein GEV33_003339 [Tenebrio molitor]